MFVPGEILPVGKSAASSGEFGDFPQPLPSPCEQPQEVKSKRTSDGSSKPAATALCLAGRGACLRRHPGATGRNDGTSRRPSCLATWPKTEGNGSASEHVEQGASDRTRIQRRPGVALRPVVGHPDLRAPQAWGQLVGTGPDLLASQGQEPSVVYDNFAERRPDPKTRTVHPWRGRTARANRRGRSDQAGRRGRIGHAPRQWSDRRTADQEPSARNAS
jgi:hypothetical protein